MQLVKLTKLIDDSEKVYQRGSSLWLILNFNEYVNLINGITIFEYRQDDDLQ